ncbi:zinc finger protein 423-like isoform X2 [Limulus polyphemus]|uniref:Zinc finger protein 423-like isoform X2 n=1 Tax=Limulus polyphemus TaxID=6850 RepID=A0ABM1SWX8_LIMPO|nr:zinc finger protein 423-like isoform X2 [Limulus polyphemus]
MGTENSFESGLNGGMRTPTSWRSSDTPDDQSLSMSPTSCTTPSDPDVDLSYTIGVTENTPHACQFCEKAFPRLSYLKRHEQIHSDQMPFKCDYCQRLFKHKRSRDRHIKLHTGDKKYRCPHCESAFSRSDHLKIHMKTHDHAKPFQCTVCNRGYNTAAALTSHVQNHNKKQAVYTSSIAHARSQSFRCLQCSTYFLNAKDLQAHVGAHCGETPSPSDKTSRCTFCHEPCLSPEALLLHVQQNHPSKSQGKHLSYQDIYPSVQDLVHHGKIPDDVEMESISSSVEVKREYNNFPRGFCTRNGFSSLDVVQLHVQTEHLSTTGKDVGQILLNYPSFFNFSSLALSLQQREIRNNNGSFTCEYCNTRFDSVQSLQKHTLSAHNLTDLLDNVEENLYCSHCNVTFLNINSLSEHLKSIHEGRNRSPKSQQSPARSKGSSSDSSPGIATETSDNSSINLKLHTSKEPPVNGTIQQFLHSGPLLCSQCSAGFPDFESFRTHLKMHLEEVIPKYTCRECEDEFATEDQLDAHVMSHFLSTTTEYSCQCCYKLFSKPDELQKHLIDIHSHLLYKCSLCKEMFNSKGSIQTHFAVKHSNEYRLFECIPCKVIFRTEVEFQLHVKVMHMFKTHPFRCLLCDQCFPTEFQRQYHLNTHIKQFICTFCEEAFHVEFLLDKHIQACHSDHRSIPTSDVQNLSLKPPDLKDKTMAPSLECRKDLRCEICDSCFSSESHLNSHRRQVHNIRISGSQKPGQATLSLFCAYCNESCKSRSDLENHMKAHTISPSKHKCNICDEVCPTAATLAEHKLNHCKVLTASTCVTCKKSVQNENEFYCHVQQHVTNGLPVHCVICQQTLMSDMEIQVHAKFHLKNCDRFYHCCVCAKRYEMDNLIITGKQDNGHTYMCKDCFYTKSEDLRCPDCHVKFEAFAALEKHRLTHKKTYQCIKCQMSFKSEAEIQAHVTSHMAQEGTKHECKLCQTVFESPAKLQCHLITHTFEGCSFYTCYMCSAVFTSPHLIQQHMLQHGLSSRPYDCANCHQRFFFRAELENHSHVHKESNASEEQANCPEHKKVFNNTVSLNHHSKIHEQKSDTLQCPLCPEVFRNSDEAQQHYFRYHGDTELQDGNKSFPCTECGKVFPCLSNLQGHIKIHTQRFAPTRNLNIHMRSHSGGKPYECPLCKKRFALKENRKAHLKSHAGLKPFMCPHCGKTFSRKCHMKEHMCIHITSTTYPCEFCSETFSSLKQLKRHLVGVHHKHYDHVCRVCGDVFKHLRNFQSHMQKNHDVTTTNTEKKFPEDLSDSSPGQSSTSGDKNDFEGSETSSLVEGGNARNSPDRTVDNNISLSSKAAA